MSADQDFLPLNGTDYIEFWVGNSKQAAYFYQMAFGFQPLAYAGLETGQTDRTSYVVKQGKIRLMFTSSLKGENEVSRHAMMHGDGVKAIALMVDDANKAWRETTSRGAVSYIPPTETKDEFGKVVTSGIRIYGETVHLFIERKDYKGAFLPGFAKWETQNISTPTGLRYIDHMVGNVGWGEMNKWVDFYANVMGFNQLISFDDKDISTEYTALMSKVMCNGNERIKFPINEPAEGLKKSQVEEYLDFYGTSGVQHIAMETDDIIETVEDLKSRGIEFLEVPKGYYDFVTDRVGEIEEDLNNLSKLGILIDRDEDGYLLQIFTKPLVDRPTLFFEIIQRKGARSFGKGNFKALFEAIELEQSKRGTLK